MATITLVGTAYPYRGGLAAFNERLVAAWRQQGHNARILTFTVQYPRWLFPGRSQFSPRPKPDLPIERAVHSFNPINWIQVGRRLRRERPDLVVFKFWLPFMGPCFGTIARMAQQNGVTRIAAILDNVIPHERRFADVALTRYFLKSCHCLAVMSDQVLADLNQLAVDQKVIRLFHPPYDYGPAVDPLQAQHRLGLEPGFCYALFFGFIRRYKGLDLLLQAMADARLSRSKLKLIVAGEFYDAEQPYFDLVARLGLSEQVIFHNHFIADELVPLYFSACDFVVLPYREATQSGIAQIAFQYHKPVMATAVGGLPEVVISGQTGLIASPEPAALAQTLVLMLDDEMRKGLAARIHERQQHSGWQAFAEQLLEGCEKFRR
ncbi:MAG: glycosyltransferase [Chitinophagales bacterium]|nr:glycosyltransferase [Chitinophagales bacterium]MDW8394418.1 glycosyltransferase [Chitinophagales bacterium]